MSRPDPIRAGLFAVTVVLALLVTLASPVGEEVVRLLTPEPEPVSAAMPLSCPPGPWGEHWWRPLGWGRVGDCLATWIHSARTQSPDPDRAARLGQAALRRTTGVALATLATTLELRRAPRLGPPPAEVNVRITRVRYCPGARPLWELLWAEGEALEPWRAVVEIEGVGVEDPQAGLLGAGRFLITEFDWGRVPEPPGADLPHLTDEEMDP